MSGSIWLSTVEAIGWACLALLLVLLMQAPTDSAPGRAAQSRQVEAAQPAGSQQLPLAQQQQQQHQLAGLGAGGSKVLSAAANLLGANSLAPLGAVKPAELGLQTSSREIEKQIVDKILGEGYDKRIRPAGSGPYNASRPGEY